MNLKQVLPSVGIAVVLGVAAFGISLLAGVLRAPTQPATSNQQPIQVPPITIASTFANGVYTFNGSVFVPDSCDQLSTHMQAVAGDPVHVAVELTTSKPQTTCTDTGATNQSFVFSLSVPPSSSSTPIIDSVTVDGMSTQFTVATSSMKKQ